MGAHSQKNSAPPKKRSEGLTVHSPLCQLPKGCKVAERCRNRGWAVVTLHYLVQINCLPHYQEFQEFRETRFLPATLLFSQMLLNSRSQAPANACPGFSCILLSLLVSP